MYHVGDLFKQEKSNQSITKNPANNLNNFLKEVN